MYQKTRESDLQRQSAQITEFYAPLHILLMKAEVAYSVFSHLQAEKKAVEAGQLFQKVLISNNDQIISIVLAKSHLIDPADDFKTYVAFIIHAELLKLNVGQESFKIQHETVAFPRDLPHNVAGRYNQLRNSYFRKLKEAE